MRRVVAIAVAFTSLGIVLGFHLRGGSPTANAEKCSAKNADVNADGTVDLSDAVTILGNLFLGNPTELVPLCATQGPPGLPDTGQTQCYDCSGQPTECLDCTGRPRPCGGFTGNFLSLQDSMQRTGCPSEGRFVDNGDGTVTDHCTGLMWQKDTADVNLSGDVTDEDLVSWCDALRYCNIVEFAGHDDWRLPNVRELESIVDYGRLGPAIDPVFSAFSRQYWSSTSLAGDPGFVWFVGFSGGSVQDTGKGNRSFVRAVRNAP